MQYVAKIQLENCNNLDKLNKQLQNYDAAIIQTCCLTSETVDFLRNLADKQYPFHLYHGLPWMSNMQYMPEMESYNEQLKYYKQVMDFIPYQRRALWLRNLLATRPMLDRLKIVFKRMVDFEMAWDTRIRCTSYTESSDTKNLLIHNNLKPLCGLNGHTLPNWAIEKISTFLNDIAVWYSIEGLETTGTNALVNEHIKFTPYCDIRELGISANYQFRNIVHNECAKNCILCPYR